MPRRRSKKGQKTEEMAPIEKLFYSYANNSSKIIDPEGIESLCTDLEMDHTDVRILMLAWKMQAEKHGFFTLAEWRRGLEALEADTLIKLKKALTELERAVRGQPSFVEFHCYAFRYCLTEERQRTVDIDSICVLLDLVLGSQFREQVDSLVRYLESQTEYKVISLDQWMGFYGFCNEISFPDLGNYDPDIGWPSILDDFVDWMKEEKRACTAAFARLRL